jgi:succinate dehydrogenase / fumarate reductase cytochrome b subunit
MASSSETAPHKRPLSPHLQIYSWPVTMLTSILHRATGVANATGTLVLTAWLVAAASGPDTFAMMRDMLTSLPGKIILALYTLSLSYHLLNGIRHLAWDTGAGLDVRTARVSGLLVLSGAIILAGIICGLAYVIGAERHP